jgi:hypothetical protein
MARTSVNVCSWPHGGHLPKQRRQLSAKNSLVRRSDWQSFPISSLAIESTPLGMVKSGAFGQLFFCDCGH